MTTPVDDRVGPPAPPEAESIAERRPVRLLGRIVLLAIANGLLWAALVPPWQMPDEPKHLEYVRLLATRGDAAAFATESELGEPALQAAILDSMDGHDFWWYGRAPGYDAAQPPSSFADVWKLGTHTAYYRASPAYYWLAARFQPDGLLAGLYAARLLSVFFGACVVLATGLAARALFPSDPLVRYGAPLFVALHPMVAFVHAGVNSDGLSNAVMAVVLSLAVATAARGASPARVAVLVAALIAAVAIKRIGLALVPAVGLAVVLGVFRRSGRPARLVPAGLVAVTVLLAASAAGWVAWGMIPQAVRWTWLRYAFNEPDQLARILGVARTTEAWPALAAYAWRISAGFWGDFGWSAIAWPTPVALTLTAVSASAMLGLLRRPPGSGSGSAGLLPLVVAVTGVLSAAVLFFGAYLAMPYAQPPQGRYLVAVAPAIAILVCAGWSAWLPHGQERRARALLALLVVMTALDIAALFGLVVPYYYA